MTGWFQDLGAELGGLVGQALQEAGQEPASPWAMPCPLPLIEVDWATAIPLEAVAGANETQWPPTPVYPRVERLKLYHDLWRGDLSSIMDVRQLRQSGVGPINVFRRVAKFVADLLVREAPEAEGSDDLQAMNLVVLAHDLISDMVRYGAGLLLVADGSEGPLIQRLDAQYAVPTAEGGWVVAEPRMSPTATSTTPDVLQFTVIHDGEAGVMQRTQTPTGVQAGTNLGPVLSSGIIGTDAEVVTLPALPTQPGGTWGTSWYDDLITVVVQTARRAAGNTKVLDENTAPFMLLRGDLNRYTTLDGVAPSRAVVNPAQVEHDQAIYRRLRQAGPWVMPDGVEDAEYVTWDGNLEASMAMLEWIDKQFRLLSGIPGVLDSDEAVPSGISLRRMFWQFDAAVSPMHHSISLALENALERFGGTLEWENVFEVVAESPGMTQREDVEDEDEADRGQNDPPEPEE